MSIVLLSEHYRPRVGGVTSYIDKLVFHLVQRDLEIILLVPGESSSGEISEDRERGFTIVHFGTGINLKGNISKERRISFCEGASNWIVANIKEYKITAVHVLFGLYLLKYLDLNELTGSILRTCTIHNVPPQETALSWKGDRRLNRIKDSIRRRGVKYVNRVRITAQKWDKYIVPSEHVRDQLANYVPIKDIEVIYHGVGDIYSEPRNEITEPVKILTVSGITPHKRLHEAIVTAKLLKAKGYEFTWWLVGPNKNERYYNYLNNMISTMDLKSEVKILQNVQTSELIKLYEEVDVYVHASKEEGFCLAFLEALAFGIATVGCATGAIPRMIEEGRGILVEGSPESILKAVITIIRQPDSYGLKSSEREELRKVFSWEQAAERHKQLWYSNFNRSLS